MNIQKRELCVKGILAQDLGSFGGGFNFFISREGATQDMPPRRHVLSLPKEASVCCQDMSVGIESEEVAKGLDGDE